MTKAEAIALFGTRQLDLAAALGLTKQAVSAWPDQLPEPVADRVRGAALRLGRISADEATSPPRPDPEEAPGGTEAAGAGAEAAA